MAVAIKTRYLGPTYTKPSRVVASTCDTGPRRSATVNWDHGLRPDENHAAAAKKLAEKLEWAGEWHIADGGEVYLFVRVGEWSKQFTVEDAH